MNNRIPYERPVADFSAILLLRSRSDWRLAFAADSRPLPLYISFFSSSFLFSSLIKNERFSSDQSPKILLSSCNFPECLGDTYYSFHQRRCVCPKGFVLNGNRCSLPPGMWMAASLVNLVTFLFSSRFQS